MTRSSLIRSVDSADEIVSAAARLRECLRSRPLIAREVIGILERWGAALHGAELDAVPGVPFLRLWLRRGTLEPIVVRELGPGALAGEWRDERGARLGIFPQGVVGHWPAANIEIQPLLSLSCALLGGNASLVRVPDSLMQQTAAMLARLPEVDGGSVLAERIFVAGFDHARQDLQHAMAASVDGAMIWGGAEAITQIRALPFPPWARLAMFGPRLSVAAMDADCWADAGQRASWCQRIARDVWQFDQQACSSPQALFLERRAGCDAQAFVRELAAALETENRAHPRDEIHPALTSAICLARASWLFGDAARHAVFPATPAWTLLVGAGPDLPRPVQGRTLSILLVDELAEPIARFDGAVQTLGLAIGDAAKETRLAQAAGRNGVDRIVKLGRMHVFGSPWDGSDMIRPMVRLVRHVPSNGSQSSGGRAGEPP
jgi:Acyl-CoA reductase (LuxC)